jgi:hypothetical protein
MKKSFDECMHSLLCDSGLDSARGGKILKYKDDIGFGYILHNQPYNQEESFLELLPSANPQESKWIVVFPGEHEGEAKKAFQNFKSNPQNEF